MTASTSAAESRETSGGVTVATRSLASVSMECGPGSVTGCSAVNNDLVVCAAQECCNVWEYSTQNGGKRERERVSEGGKGRTDPVCNSLTSLSPERGVGQISLFIIKWLQEENHYCLGEWAFREHLQRTNVDRFNLATDTDLDSPS